MCQCVMLVVQNQLRPRSSRRRSKVTMMENSHESCRRPDALKKLRTKRPYILAPPTDVVLTVIRVYLVDIRTTASTGRAVRLPHYLVRRLTLAWNLYSTVYMAYSILERPRTSTRAEHAINELLWMIYHSAKGFRLSSPAAAANGPPMPPTV